MAEAHLTIYGGMMPQTIINNDELLETIKTRVGSNGTISIGKKHAGKQVTAYIVGAQGSDNIANANRCSTK